MNKPSKIQPDYPAKPGLYLAHCGKGAKTKKPDDPWTHVVKIDGSVPFFRSVSWRWQDGSDVDDYFAGAQVTVWGPEISMLEEV